MHDLYPSRTPMWSFGHTNLGDRWIPVALPPPVLSRPKFSATFGPAQIPKNSGRCCGNLRTSALPSTGTIVSARLFVSGPPHFRESVRNSQAIDYVMLFDAAAFRTFAEFLGVADATRIRELDKSRWAEFAFFETSSLAPRAIEPRSNVPVA
jgi:hypothetical protein